MNFDPINLVKSISDIVSKSERSSGFRPLIIVIPIAMCLGFTLMILNQSLLPQTIGAILLIFPLLYFFKIFDHKAKTDPDFCRSETHIHKMAKLEVEKLGYKGKEIDADIVENELENIEPPPMIEHKSGTVVRDNGK